MTLYHVLSRLCRVGTSYIDTRTVSTHVALLPLSMSQSTGRPLGRKKIANAMPPLALWGLLKVSAFKLGVGSVAN